LEELHNSGHDLIHRLPRDFYNFLDDSPPGTRKSNFVDASSQCDQLNTSIDRKPSLPPYVEAVLKESMRRYPAAPVSVMRLVTDPRGFTIPKVLLTEDRTQCRDNDDIVVPAGSWVLVNALALHHAPAQWGPDALSFEPERWLSDEECTESWASPKSSSTASINDRECSEILPESPTPVMDQGLEDDGIHPVSSGEKGIKDASVATFVLDTGEYLDDRGATFPTDGVRDSEELCFTPLSLALREFSALDLAMDVVRVVITDIAQRFEFVSVDDSVDGSPLMVRVRDRLEK